MSSTVKKDSLARSTLNNSAVGRPNGGQSNAAPPAVAATSHAAPAHHATATTGSSRWWVAVSVGTLVILPIGWLLSYAAALPFMIGTFFFALLGLIVGAITFRIARGHMPYTTGAVIAGTTVIVLAGWGYSIHVEASDLPAVMGEVALRDTRDLADRTADQFEAEVAQAVRSYMGKNFAPGGTVGYVRWVVTSGQIARGEAPPVGTTLSVHQRGWVWLFRVTLSLGLLAFGVASQTLPLAPRATPSSIPPQTVP